MYAYIVLKLSAHASLFGYKFGYFGGMNNISLLYIHFYPSQENSLNLNYILFLCISFDDEKSMVKSYGNSNGMDEKFMIHNLGI